MEKYNKLIRNITELIEKGLFTSKDLKKEVEDSLKFKIESILSDKTGNTQGITFNIKPPSIAIKKM